MQNGIDFWIDGFKFCNKISSINGCGPEPYTKDICQKIAETRTTLLNECIKGNIPNYCKNCIYLQKRNWSSVCKIKQIEIYHWLHCNCACTYCCNREITNLQITNKKRDGEFINLLPIIKTLNSKNLIDKEAKVYFNGGEPAILKEFVPLVKIFDKLNCSMSFLSNGIIYEKTIGKSIRKNEKNSLTISLDCGNKETYKKIKGVDKFDDVIKNIEKYIKDSKENDRSIIIKYILLPGINDNREEIDAWLKICKKLNVKTLQPTIEYHHSLKSSESSVIPQNIIEWYNYTKTKIVAEGFSMCVYDFVEKLVASKNYSL